MNFLKTTLIFSLFLLSGCQTMNNVKDKWNSFSFFSKEERETRTASAAPAHYNEQSKKVAILLPMSGPQKSIGVHLKQAAQISLFDMADQDFEIKFYDTRGDLSETKRQAQKAISDGSGLIIGPLFSHTTLAAAKEVSGKAPIISLSNNESIAAESVYPFGFHVDDQVDRLFETCKDNGITNIAVVCPESRYGNMVAADVQKMSFKHGISANIIRYKPGTDMKAAADKIKQETDLQAILIPEGGRALKVVVSNLLVNDVDLSNVKLLGTSQWASPDSRFSSVAGGWYVAPLSQRQKGFVKEYRRLYGINPPRIATLTYDAVALAAHLVRSDPNTPFKHTNLANGEGFEGVGGVFKLDSGGKVSRSLAVLEIAQGGQPTVISGEKFPA